MSELTELFFVEIVKYGETKPEKQIGPVTMRAALKIQDGADINLNHDDYFTRIVPVQGAEKECRR